MTQLIYVNTDNVSGTENGLTIATGWVDMSDAIADVVTSSPFTEDVIIHASGATSDTSTPDFTGYNVNGFSLEVIGDYSGFGWNASEYKIVSTNNGELSVNTDVILKNIQCENTGTNNTRWPLQTSLSATEFARFENSIFRITGTGGTSAKAVDNADPTVIHQRIWVNCTFVNPFNYAFETGGSIDGGDVLYNCNAHDSSQGFRNLSQQAILKNCLSDSNTTDWSGGGAFTGSVTNLSSDGTAYGTSPILNATLTFEDSANQDYRLVVGDTDAIGAATDLSADSIFAFNYDAAGNTRSSWDIGAHEYQGVGDTTPPTFSVAPAVSSVTSTGGTATATIGETGDIYYVVVADGATAPTPAEVIAGTGSGGSGEIDSGSALAGTVLSDTFTGLTGNTAYDVYFIARDDEGSPNVQASVTKVDITTQSATITINTDLISGTIDGVLFDGPLESSSTVLIDIDGETMNGSGQLVVDLNAVSVTNSQALEGIGKDRVTGDPIPLQGTVSIA